MDMPRLAGPGFDRVLPGALQSKRLRFHTMTQPLRESTTVAIAGGGVSGLTAAALLRSRGVDSIVRERRTRSHVEERQRAGLVEHGHLPGAHLAVPGVLQLAG
jgi:hypothetical protein